MTESHGTPIWYELMVPPGDLPKAAAFYGKVFGWQIGDSGMEGFSYHLAQAGAQMVAGMIETPDPQIPPNWLFYTAVGNCDDSARAAENAGGKVLNPPQDVPGTGRFAVLADPQGAVFGVLEPAPMDTPPEGRAYDPAMPGHGAWHELMTPDPQAALAFYGALFGWSPGMTVRMGENGDYQLVKLDDQDIGGVMGLMGAPMPYWMPYFWAESIDATSAAITGAGGAILHGPVEVPGGARIVVARDPSGAVFGVTAPR